MKCNFLVWYSQALGATLGIIACIFAYLNGYMFVYSNINKYFDFLNFRGVISSYLLFPLCIITLLLSVIRSTIKSEKLANISFTYLNSIIAIITIIIGFLGCKIYFAIPAIFIILSIYPFKDKVGNDIEVEYDDSITYEEQIEQTFDNQKTSIFFSNHQIQNLEKKDSKLYSTKIDMAIELLSKGASDNFIYEITGLSNDEIEKLKENSKI
ncbi:MAG: hypothetical protein RRZ84_03730 [Romboutsia sp.]